MKKIHAIPAGFYTVFPEKDAADITELYSQKEALRTHLHEKGAILLRGFQLDDPEKFKTVAGMFTQDFMEDNGEHNPLSGTQGVFTPVTFSQKEKLLWHNENSFNQTWPLVIVFGAARVADKGGETPIADSRTVLSFIDDDIKNTFLEKGVMYVRTHGFGLGRSWQETYRVTDKATLELKLKKENVLFEWREDDKLITRQVRPAIIAHPITGELSWFTQAQHWHPYCLKPAVRASLLNLFSEDTLPRNCHFGDGSVISDEVMQHILNAYKQAEISFSWEQGDVMVLDNVLCAHARNPYEGERKLLVTMGEPRMFGVS